MELFPRLTFIGQRIQLRRIRNNHSSREGQDFRAINGPGHDHAGLFHCYLSQKLVLVHLSPGLGELDVGDWLYVFRRKLICGGGKLE